MRFGQSFERWAFSAGLIVLGALSACGTEGRTPACDSFPDLYDVRSAEQREAARAAIDRAAAEGCLTAPAPAVGGSAGATTAGAAGDGGTAGEAGDGGTAGAE